MKNTLYGRFREWVLKSPDAPAIVEQDRTLSYKDLDLMTDCICYRLPCDLAAPVGIVMSHRAEMVAAMFAVLKRGLPYVAAEPSLPHSRLEYMMEDSAVSFVITDDFCDVAKGGRRLSASLPDRSASAGLAYILYTSGTTGKPKGVVVENRNVVNYAEAFEREFHIGRGDVMLQFSVCSFDIFVEEVFAALLNGAALAIPPAEVCAEGIGALMHFVEEHAVTIISGFPHMIAEINELATLPSSVRLLISGGDVLRHRYIDRLKGRGVEIYNTYGPTETTVCATYCRCDDRPPLADGTYPIGRPVYGVEVHLLSPDGLREVPDGQEGEICILGSGVSHGYVGNPPEARNFVHLVDGRRMYRSGDLGYRLPDGNIVFVRRKDGQVMISGKRVEPEGVENLLSNCDMVERAVVCAYTDTLGQAYMTAFVVPAHEGFSVKALKEWLSERLPAFMIPEFFVAVRQIPLTDRGKVDYAQLPVVLKDD